VQKTAIQAVSEAENAAEGHWPGKLPMYSLMNPISLDRRSVADR
jgi:hypothetical protein